VVDYLILTEKKSAFDNFVTALGGETGTVNGHTYQLTHAQGHLLEFLDPVDQVAPNLKDKYESWELKDLPWNLQDLTWRKKAKNGSAQKMIKKIANESRQAQAIVIATDNDPSGEGELLAWEIINAINWRGPVYREYHDDESKKGIQKALRNLRDISSQEKDGDYIKAILRQRWDFASMQATRVSTTLARSEGYRVKVINQGRLKSVMLAFTFDQLQRIKHYQKKPYYEIKFKDNNGHIYARKVKKEDDELIKKVRHADIKLAKQEQSTYSSPTEVKLLSCTRKKQVPNTLIDMTGIDSAMAAKGYSSTMVEEVYQELYEKHYLSYPRTGDKVITNDQFIELVNNADRIAATINVDQSLLTHRQPREKFVKDSATHGANRPGEKVPETMDELKKAISSKSEKAQDCAVDIYKLVAASALSILAEDYVYDSYEACVVNYPDFVTHFNQPVEYNYRLIYSEDNLPKQQQPIGSSAITFIDEGANPKPAWPTKKWLYRRLSAYGKYGIGTPATQQSTLAAITSNNGLLKAKGAKLNLTDTGLMSALIGYNTYIASPKITAQLFDAMDVVAKFEMDPIEVLNTVTQVIKHDIPIMQRNAKHLKDILGAPKKVKYEKKEKVMVQFQGKAVQISRKWGTHTFTDQELEDLSAGKIITFKYKKGNLSGQLGQSEYKGRKFIGFIPDFKKRGK